jgi:hypothetical protein
LKFELRSAEVENVVGNNNAFSSLSLSFPFLLSPFPPIVTWLNLSTRPFLNDIILFYCENPPADDVAEVHALLQSNLGQLPLHISPVSSPQTSDLIQKDIRVSGRSYVDNHQMSLKERSGGGPRAILAQASTYHVVPQECRQRPARKSRPYIL